MLNAHIPGIPTFTYFDGLEEASMSSCVYQIVNLINGHRYVGSARNFESRCKEHKAYLNGGYHGNKHLLAAWRKYGAENFVFEVLEMCHPDDRFNVEQRHIDQGCDYNNEIRVRGNVPRVVSEETKRRMSESHKGKTYNTTGKKRSREQKAKMSNSIARWWAERKSTT
jgi:group I intron endonuclease